MAITIPSSPAVGDPGTAGWADQVAAATSALAAPPQFDGFNSVTQSIPNGAFTALLLDSENYDTVGGHSTSTNTSRYTIQTGWDGRYDVTVRYSAAANATGVRVASVGINGVQQVLAQVEQAGFSGGSNTLTATWLTPYLNAGDYIEGMAFQNITGGSALVTTAGACGVQIIRVGQ